MFNELHKEWSAKHVWEYQTNPTHPFDKTLWPLLRPIMLLFADGKISHWWHWQTIPLRPEYIGTKLEGDPNHFPIRRGNKLIEAYDHLRMSLGGWQSGYIIHPDRKTVDLDLLEQGWRYGFGDLTGRSTIRLCSIILGGPIRLLRGPDNFKVYALTAYNLNELPLQVHGPIPRRFWPIV